MVTKRFTVVSIDKLIYPSVSVRNLDFYGVYFVLGMDNELYLWSPCIVLGLSVRLYVSTSTGPRFNSRPEQLT